MELRKGDLYSDENFSKYDWVGFTANRVIKANGALVMGAGNAKVVRDKWRGIDKVFGELLSGKEDVYGIVADPETRIFAFQTKIHYKDKSDITAIVCAKLMLKKAAERCPDKLFAVPFPGISNGGLDRDRVLEIIKDLPDNVHVWEL